MAYTLGNVYTMPAFTGNGTQNITVEYAQGQMARIQITIPTGKVVTAYSTVVGTQTDTYGQLCDGATDTFSGKTPSGVTRFAYGDDQHGSGQWEFSYQNTTGADATWYIYHSGYSETTAGATNVIYVTVSDAWVLGTTYTMAAFGTTDGTYTNNVTFSTAGTTLSRVQVDVPPYAMMTFYSAESGNADLFGYLCSSATPTINAMTGAVTTAVISSDDNSQGNSQWKLTYDNSINGTAVTVYIFTKHKTAGTASSGTIYGQAVVRIPNWALGSTGTLANSGQIGVFTSSSYTLNTEKTNRYTFNVPARSYFKIHSEFPYDTVGYIGEATSTINVGSGAPEVYVSTDDASFPVGTSQFELLYMNKTNSNKTIYIFVRFKKFSDTGAGRLVYEVSQMATLPSTETKTSVIKRYNGTAWETVYM